MALHEPICNALLASISCGCFWSYERIEQDTEVVSELKFVSATLGDGVYVIENSCQSHNLYNATRIEYTSNHFNSQKLKL